MVAAGFLDLETALLIVKQPINLHTKQVDMQVAHLDKVTDSSDICVWCLGVFINVLYMPWYVFPWIYVLYMP